MTWLGWDDPLVREAIPDWHMGLESKLNPDGSLWVKVKTHSGETKEAIISAETRNAFYRKLFKKLNGREPATLEEQVNDRRNNLLKRLVCPHCLEKVDPTPEEIMISVAWVETRYKCPRCGYQEQKGKEVSNNNKDN